MQIEPATARAYGFDPSRLHNPAYNRMAGTAILTSLVDEHKGNEREALKSYYGRGKAGKGMPTTDEYADKVLKMAGSPTSSGTPMQRMIADPGFAKMNQPQMYDAVMAGLERSEPGFTTKDPAFKHRVATEILTRAGKLKTGTALQGGGGELRKPLPGAVEFGENYVAPAVAGTAGALGGAAVGGAVGGPPGAVAGGAAGAGVGVAAADYLSARINKTFFGRNPDLSWPNVAKNEAVNAAIGAASELIPVGRVAGSIVGINPLLEGAGLAQQEAAGAAERFGEQQEASGQARLAAGVGARDKTAQALAPEARGQAIQQRLGRTARQGAQARATPAEQVGKAALPSEETIDRQQQWGDAVFNPIHRASNELGHKYETLFAGVKTKPIQDTDAIKSKVAQIAQFGQDTGHSPGPQLRGLMQRADALAAPKPVDIGAMLKSKKTLSMSNEEWAALKQRMSTGDTSGGTPANIQSLLGLRSDALGLIRGGASPRDKSAAFDLIEGIDSTLENSGLVDKNQLTAINRRYGSYRRTFDTSFRRKIAGEFEPTDAAGDIFGSPQRIEQIWKGATDEEKSTLRGTYADWLLKNGVDKAPGIMKQEDQQQVLQKLYPGTPLADPANWVHLEDKLVSAENVMNTSPQLRQEFQKQMAARLTEIRTEAAGEAVKWAQKEAKNLGPYGEAMAKQARLARTPEEGAQVVMDFMKRHPENAAIESLMSGRVEEGAIGKSLKARVLRGLTWYPEILVATSLMGHPSMFAAAGLGIGAITGVHGGMQYLVKAALKNPRNAQMLWEAANSGSAPIRSRILGRMLADAVTADAAAGLQRKAGTSLKQQGEEQPTSE